MNTICKPKQTSRINNRNEKIIEKGKEPPKKGNGGNLNQHEKKFSQIQAPAKINKISNTAAHIATPRPAKLAKSMLPPRFSPMRKSNSSMEFRHVQHRQMNMLVASPYPYDKNLALNQITENAAHQKGDEDKSFYYVLQENYPNKFDMKIFNFTMLFAWRKRRDEVKKLNNELTDLKRFSIRNKNQLHVLNSLFHVEAKRSEEINANLKRTMEELHNTMLESECLATNVERLKMEKIYLQSNLENSEKEVRLLKDNLRCLITELEQNKNAQAELRMNLELQECKLNELEICKNNLIDEVCDLTNQLKELKIEHEKEMNCKKAELEYCAEEKLNLKLEVEKLEEKLTIIPKLKRNEDDLIKNIDQLKREVETLQCCLAATLGNRIKKCLDDALFYPRTTFHMVHWLAFYLLPATPPPRLSTIPFRFSLQKAMGIVRH